MNTLRVWITALSLTTLLLAGQLVQADDLASFITGKYESGIRNMDTMHAIDTDGDGMVSLEEWLVFQNRVFSALDKSNSGFIDAADFYGTDLDMTPVAPAAFITGLRTKEMFTKIGPDAQGKISRDEFLRFQQKIFEMMDKDHKKNLGPGDFILNK
jgi:EF hand